MPPTDNSHFLRLAAIQRHNDAVQRTTRALRDAARTGSPVSFRTIAAAAKVSRSWLYTQAELRAETERLRGLAARSRNHSVAARDRTSEKSLVRRLETLTAENQRLGATIQRLRQELAASKIELANLHGELRRAR